MVCGKYTPNRLQTVGTETSGAKERDQYTKRKLQVAGIRDSDITEHRKQKRFHSGACQSVTQDDDIADPTPKENYKNLSQSSS